ncbi:hypothetical protein CR513_36264, partial [Mucuna pruriens]
MGGSLIRIDRMIINNSRGSHTNRIQIKGSTTIPLTIATTSPRDNSSTMEDWVQQMSKCNIQFQQYLTSRIHDLKMQVGQLADLLVSSRNIPSQTIPNPKREGIGVMML